jgi:hypothetical protein
MKNRKMSTVKAGVVLLKQMGILCYDYVDSPEALDVDYLYPSRNFTTNSQTVHAIQRIIWTLRRCGTILAARHLNYHDIYLHTDVALLADFLQNFRFLYFKYYKIDPVAYISAPQIFWDAMLKYTGVRLDVLLDQEMYLYWEKHKWGGTTFLNEQYATANKKYIPGYDADKPSNYLL